MVKINKHGCTPKQEAYARRVWAGAGPDRKTIALDVGYTKNAANSIISKIESRPGFNNAMARLAAESGAMALSVMHEYKARGLQDFSNKDLNGAMNAIAGAWSKFTQERGPRNMDGPGTKLGNNKLRTIILQRVENQTITNEGPNPLKKDDTPEAELKSETESFDPSEASIDNVVEEEREFREEDLDF